MSGDGAQMLDELRQQLRKSLADSETLSRQVQALQTRLEDASREQESLELQIHDKDTKIDGMTNEHRELVKQRRELQDLVEAERGSLVQERERALEQERQSRAVIQRLKESLTQKANRASLEWHEQKSEDNGPASRSNHGHFAPLAMSPPVTPRQRSIASLEKDKVIESLRLELAESQIKLMGLENVKGVGAAALEKELLDSRMMIARLTEESESYQLLLNEKTLNGNFSRTNTMRVSSSGGGSHHSDSRIGERSTTLADELDSVTEADNEHDESLKDAEIKKLQAEVKALGFYINRLLGKLLQHENFESVLENNQTVGGGSVPGPAQRPPLKTVNTDKDLPVTPPREEPAIKDRPRPIGPGGLRANPRPRPLSYMSVSPSGGYQGNGPTRSLSGQLGRSASVRRTSSRAVSFEQTEAALTGASSRTDDTRPTNPAMRSSAAVPASRRYSLFSSMSGLGSINAQMKVSPGQQTSAEKDQSDHSTYDGLTSGEQHVESDGGVPAAVAPGHVPANTASSPAPATAFGGKTLRPLRLVQGQAGVEPAGPSKEEEEAAKKARRSSWMGWFNKGKSGGEGSSSSSFTTAMGGNVVRE